MLIESQRWPGTRDGSITDLFRRWRQASAGEVYRIGAGRIVVDIVPPVDITAKNARASA